MAKQNTTKEVLAEAKDEIFEGKSVTIKNHFQSLLGTSDGIKARLAITVKKIEEELADNEEKIKYFSGLSFEDAYNEIIYNQNTQATPWYLPGSVIYNTTSR